MQELLGPHPALTIVLGIFAFFAVVRLVLALWERRAK